MLRQDKVEMRKNKLVKTMKLNKQINNVYNKKQFKKTEDHR